MFVAGGVFILPLVLTLALLFDVAFGEPPTRFHPTAWMGRLVSLLETRLGNSSPSVEKLEGVFLAAVTVVFFVSAAYLCLLLISEYLGLIVYFAASGLILKLSFAVRSMETHAVPVAEALEGGDITKARKLVSLIVRRETSALNSEQVISATVESVAEGTVDGVGAPLFYFASLGVPGAVAYRVINTLDSMVGYEDRRYKHLGFFSAWLDTVCNFIPSRIVAVLMVLAAAFLGENWRGAWRILKRDRNNTESRNAGYPMSAMAGALNVQLEKLGFYQLGDNSEILTHNHVYRSLRIMKVTVYLSILLIVTPLSFMFSLLLG